MTQKENQVGKARYRQVHNSNLHFYYEGQLAPVSSGFQYDAKDAVPFFLTASSHPCTRP